MILREVPRKLDRESLWLRQDDNRDRLRSFLRMHGVDIRRVIEIEFNNKSFTVTQFQYTNGQITLNAGGAVTESKRVKYLSKPKIQK